MLEEANDDVDNEEFEEIHSDEVDRVVDSLAELMESVESETIADILEEASTKIYELIYDEEEEDELDEADVEVDEFDEEEDELDDCEVDEDEDDAMAA